MTNHWNDVANSDYIMGIAGNPAENHPAAYGHITKAVERGAKLLVVDPRFTRSASKAHIYCPIRSGTDVACINPAPFLPGEDHHFLIRRPPGTDTCRGN